MVAIKMPSIVHAPLLKWKKVTSTVSHLCGTIQLLRIIIFAVHEELAELTVPRPMDRKNSLTEMVTRITRLVPLGFLLVGPSEGLSILGDNK
jgi:hypothetical protein